MKQTSTPSSDLTNPNLETFQVNKSNLTEEEYKLLSKLAAKSRSNFRESIVKEGTPVYGYDPTLKERFSCMMYTQSKTGDRPLSMTLYKANILHDSPEDANLAFTKRYILGKLNYLSRNSAEPYNPWDGKHKHYFLAYHAEEDKIVILSTVSMRTGIPYFATEEAAQEAILIIGDDDIKYALCNKF